ncbi:MAG: bifunctional diaminohydroxyphosphoribosylaminopyrimidine deaminase/5-amino-6-(5-phosphoribosylamino)uracil reductase RibD [Nitrospirota bacterium]|nr:bifunctional diaminohydroxyphosphoribosylaminopyrimidine deaminase/5-amino-6-(5-phosphoribosylamino)uracil reductase RibD [Nitrospirota bacterium]
MDNDTRFMRRALTLARRGQGKTSPNPLVGAVVVKKGLIVGEGYHQRAGGPHAEVIALEGAGKKAAGATLYISLEPCCHTGKKTPPCTGAIIASGVKRVVVAMKDPNPKVSGRGIQQLRDAGIEVSVGTLGPEAQRLNEIFRKYITTGTPFVRLKIAETLDGKIATASGESQWITGEAARKHGHRLRSWSDAILVGVNTVIHDDPLLTVRSVKGKAPLRIVVDSTLRTPVTAKIVAENPVNTIIASTSAAPPQKVQSLRERGVEVLTVEDEAGKVSLPALMKALGERGITSVLIEGGAEIAAAALKSGIVDRVFFFIAPKIMGGLNSKAAIGGDSPKALSQAVSLVNVSARRIGDDFLVEGDIKKV